MIIFNLGRILMKYFIMILLFVSLPLCAQVGHEEETEIDFWEEAGYILAMEVTFTGFSLLSTLDKKIGPLGTGIGDGVIGLLGIPGIIEASRNVRWGDALGLSLVSAGFLIKAIYNFNLDPHDSKAKRFWVNFISYNFLIFSGYLITETG